MRTPRSSRCAGPENILRCNRSLSRFSFFLRVYIICFDIWMKTGSPYPTNNEPAFLSAFFHPFREKGCPGLRDCRTSPGGSRDQPRRPISAGTPRPTVSLSIHSAAVYVIGAVSLNAMDKLCTPAPTNRLTIHLVIKPVRAYSANTGRGNGEATLAITKCTFRFPVPKGLL